LSITSPARQQIGWFKLAVVTTRALHIGCTVAVIGVLSLSSSSGSLAGEPSAREHAQELLEKGNELFRAGDAVSALETYRRAYDTFASPRLFFNMGLCEEALSQPVPALRDLARFLREAPDADPGTRADAEARVAELTATLVAVDLAGLPPHAEVAVDGAAAGTAPLDGPLWIAPGRHRLSVGVPGRAPWLASVEGKAGERIPLAVPPEPPAPAARKLAGGGSLDARPAPAPADPALSPAPAPAPDAGGHHVRWPLWVALGAVVLAGAATAIILARNSCPATKCD